MFALTVDQVDSRHRADRVAGIVADAAGWRERGAVLGPDRTAGDEFQLLFRRARPALDAALLLTREGGWSVGIGVGAVDEPLPATTREATGPALAAAREAVEAAKRAPERLVVIGADAERSAGATAVLGLLVDLRARRSPEGWAVADLLAEGLPQHRIAERLGVTPQAISLRARAAGTRLELAALPAAARELAALEALGASGTSGGGPTLGA